MKSHPFSRSRAETLFRRLPRFSLLLVGLLAFRISASAAATNQAVAITNTFAWDHVQFALPSGAKESLWRDALAKHVGGTTEFKTNAGRIDVITSNEVFEVDRPNKWKEGMGQALAYAGATGKKPVLVLMSYSQGPENLQAKSKVTFDLAAKECARHDVRLLILFPSRPELPHPTTDRVER